jgi:hypothetical protein
LLETPLCRSRRLRHRRPISERRIILSDLRVESAYVERTAQVSIGKKRHRGRAQIGEALKGDAHRQKHTHAGVREGDDRGSGQGKV